MGYITVIACKKKTVVVIAYAAPYSSCNIISLRLGSVYCHKSLAPCCNYNIYVTAKWELKLYGGLQKQEL